MLLYVNTNINKTKKFKIYNNIYYFQIKKYQ